MVERTFDLQVHPATPTPIVRGVVAAVERTAETLRIAYRLDGDFNRIRIPPPAAPRIGQELWRRTCFEVFLRIAGHSAYHEFNLAPSQEWSVYALSSYRKGEPVLEERMAPQIEVRRTDAGLHLDTTIWLERLSQFHLGAPLEIGLAAVIDTDEGISYWALRHPGPKPDFHHQESFALLLPPLKDG